MFGECDNLSSAEPAGSGGSDSTIAMRASIKQAPSADTRNGISDEIPREVRDRIVSPGRVRRMSLRSV